MWKFKKDIFEDEKKTFHYKNILTYTQYNSTSENGDYIYPNWPPSYFPTNLPNYLGPLQLTINYKYFYLLITNYPSLKKDKLTLFYIPIYLLLLLLLSLGIIIFFIIRIIIFWDANFHTHIISLEVIISMLLLAIISIFEIVIRLNDISLLFHFANYFSTIFKCNNKQEVIKVINNLYITNKIDYFWYKIFYLWFYVEFSNKLDKTSVYTYHQLKTAFWHRNRKGNFYCRCIGNGVFIFKWLKDPNTKYKRYFRFAWQYPSLRDCSKWIIINNIKPPLCLPKDQKKCDKGMKKYLANRKKFDNIIELQDKKHKVNSEWKKIMEKEIKNNK